MFPQTVRQRDYFFHGLGARRDSGSANKNKLKEDWKSPCLSHFCGIRLSEKISKNLLTAPLGGGLWFSWR